MAEREQRRNVSGKRKGYSLRNQSKEREGGGGSVSSSVKWESSYASVFYKLEFFHLLSNRKFNLKYPKAKGDLLAQLSGKKSLTKRPGCLPLAWGLKRILPAPVIFIANLLRSQTILP